MCSRAVPELSHKLRHFYVEGRGQALRLGVLRQVLEAAPWCGMGRPRVLNQGLDPVPAPIPLEKERTAFPPNQVAYVDRPAQRLDGVVRGSAFQSARGSRTSVDWRAPNRSRP